jgi:hypothetical protein
MDPAELAQNVVLKNSFGAMSLLTGVLSFMMVYDTEFGWKRYFGIHEPRSISSSCYAGALVGEGFLQLLAFKLPEFAPAAVCFMLPYKVSDF